MADPRKTIAYDDIGTLNVTFKIDNSTITFSASEVGGSAQVGKAVKLAAAADTVELTTDGSEVLGELKQVYADNYGVVQVKGMSKLPQGSGAAVTLGKAIVGDTSGASSDPGYIREVASGTAAELAVQRGTIINAATATAIIVLL
jgi:hypothetical protein